MNGTLLIVSGGIEAVPGIRVVKEIGLHVVVNDMNPTAPGFAEAVAGIIASTYDVEATVEAAQRYHRTVRPIDGVMCIVSDVPVTVASVAAALDLPGIPLGAAHLAADKLDMKRKFAAGGVRVPWFSPVQSLDQITEDPGSATLEVLQGHRPNVSVITLQHYIDLRPCSARALCADSCDLHQPDHESAAGFRLLQPGDRH